LNTSSTSPPPSTPSTLNSALASDGLLRHSAQPSATVDSSLSGKSYPPYHNSPINGHPGM
jgi:hypothetical protein